MSIFKHGGKLPKKHLDITDNYPYIPEIFIDGEFIGG